MAKIFITRKVPGNAVKALLDGGHGVVISPYDRPLEKDELLQDVVGIDALLSLLTDKIDAAVFDAAGPQLKVVANYAVGFDNVDVVEATKRGIVVTNTPSDEVNEAVAEHTWALTLALARRVVEADEAVRRGAYSGWEPDIFIGTSLVGKTFGIVGLGRIGAMVARRAAGFGVKVVYYNRSRNEAVEKELGLTYLGLDELLAQSDFVSIHVPLTPETRHMFNAGLFAKMKRGSYLINTARGPIVDEHDLVAVLREGQLMGAALDVFDNEPHLNPELVNMNNVILTPHIASATTEARNKMAEAAVGAIMDTLAGNKPHNMVDEAVWDTRRKQ